MQLLKVAFVSSSFVQSSSQKAKTVRGVWGPVYGTVFPDCWLIEAGQSAVGRVLDEVILSQCIVHI